MQLLSAFPVHFHARLVILAMQMRWLGYQNFSNSTASAGHSFFGGQQCRFWSSRPLIVLQAAAAPMRLATAAAAPPCPQRTRCQVAKQIVAAACIHARSPVWPQIHPSNQQFLYFFGNTLNVLHLQQFLKYHYHLVN